MFSRIRQLSVVPDSLREQYPITAPLLNVILLALIFVGPAVTISLAILATGTILDAGVAIGFGASVIFAILWLLMRRGRVVLASWLVSAVLLLSITMAIFQFRGIRDPSTMAYILTILLAGMLLRDRKAILFFTTASVLAVVGAYFAETQGLITYPQMGVTWADVFQLGAIFVLVAVLLRFAMRNLNQAVERARESEQALAAANDELESLNMALEARVAARTRALALSAELSRRLSTILDQDVLVQEVVNQLQTAFNYYHVHIYLLDRTGRRLEMAGGTGEPGRLMLQDGHAIEVGHGLVGRAAKTNLPVLVPHVLRDLDWLANPLLPATRAEVAIPIARGDQVLGVLDVQHDEAGGLTQEDVELLQSIANQVAVGLQNARLYLQAQRQAEQEVLINAINQRLQETTSVEQALQVAVRELGRALDGREAAVTLRPLSTGANGAAETGSGVVQNGERVEAPEV